MSDDRKSKWQESTPWSVILSERYGYIPTCKLDMRVGNQHQRNREERERETSLCSAERALAVDPAFFASTNRNHLPNLALLFQISIKLARPAFGAFLGFLGFLWSLIWLCCLSWTVFGWLLVLDIQFPLHTQRTHLLAHSQRQDQVEASSVYAAPSRACHCETASHRSMGDGAEAWPTTSPGIGQAYCKRYS